MWVEFNQTKCLVCEYLTPRQFIYRSCSILKAWTKKVEKTFCAYSCKKRWGKALGQQDPTLHKHLEK
ncbi:hypothetical protein DUNSADRAFT_4492 [Dunaliella salina]|uniref:MYM-type domain-containing protein n=1 Tax=Dunaliella salina TaxID=3046 RepID=A0ABQ7FUS2_DUNSA|nr:hypothetical protein DUNSADRAFT_4492 [Dunaliella salina]|eukprot:KAF5826158.1 hypothetical protein DUNSADRAFT_4492 [Dunaliella salina]